jgi:hypothetical protein
MSRTHKAKESGLVITVWLFVLFLVFKARVLVYCALFVGLAGVLSAWLSEKIDWAWGKLDWLLGEISNRVLLTVIYFLVITPVALVRRMRKRDRLTRFEGGATSNFVVREHTFQKKDLENTW